MQPSYFGRLNNKKSSDIICYSGPSTFKVVKLGVMMEDLENNSGPSTENNNDNNDVVEKSSENVSDDSKEESNDDVKDEKSDFDLKVEEKVQSILKDRLERESNKNQKVIQGFEEKINVLNNLVSSKEQELESFKNESFKKELALSSGFDIDVIESLKGDTQEELISSLEKIKSATSGREMSNLFSGKTYENTSKSIADIINESFK